MTGDQAIGEAEQVAERAPLPAGGPYPIAELVADIRPRLAAARAAAAETSGPALREAV